MTNTEWVAGGPNHELSETTLDDLTALARASVAAGQRRILGITGAPGSGKSTLAQALADALGSDAALVSLDGFHLANVQLHRQRLHERKGAPDTFDAEGYVWLLRRLRDRSEDVVYGPLFDRRLEESLAGAIAVPREVPLVITEGNYLLIEEPPWAAVLKLLDDCWYVEPGEAVRLERLRARHMQFGRTAEEAHSRAYGSDQRNAELIAASRHRAGRIVRVPSFSLAGDDAKDEVAT